MCKEQKKLRLLVENGLQDKQVARWFRDTIPDFTENKEILGRGSFSIDTLYDKAVENEIQLILCALSGSASHVIEAVEADKWSDRVVEALMDHHIFPIMLGQTSRVLRFQLMCKDFHDLRYLGLMPKEIEGALAFLETEGKAVGIHLLLLVTSNWNTGQLECPKQNRVMQLLLAASHYGKDRIIDELWLFVPYLSDVKLQEAVLTATRAGRVGTAKKLIEGLFSSHYFTSLMQVADQICSEQSDLSDELTRFIWSFVAQKYGEDVISEWAIRNSSKTQLIRAFSFKLLSKDWMDGHFCWMLGKDIEDILYEDDYPLRLAIFAAFTTKNYSHSGYCSDPCYSSDDSSPSEDESSSDEDIVAFWTDEVDADISNLSQVRDYIYQNSHYRNCWDDNLYEGLPDAAECEEGYPVCSSERCELVGWIAITFEELRSAMLIGVD